MLSSPNHIWSDDSTNNEYSESALPRLVDRPVNHIVDMYGHDTDLLKHILTAKAEEDKRRAAEELRRAEEIKLQCKYIDWILANNDGQTAQELLSLLEDSPFANVTPDWLFPTLPTAPSVNHVSSMTTAVRDTPPSPTTSNLRPRSPSYGLFADMPFADLSISAPSSPEPTDLAPKEIKERACKRTLSRARSQRRPQVGEKKKYRSMPPSSRAEADLFPNSPQTAIQPQEQLDHDKVMEALRAKLRRSSNPPKHYIQPQTPDPHRSEDSLKNMPSKKTLLSDLKSIMATSTIPANTTSATSETKTTITTTTTADHYPAASCTTVSHPMPLFASPVNL